jgi:DNA-binding response OmpR family regulator
VTAGPALLLVEDDPDLLGLLADGLRSAGHRVLTAADGGRAVELLASHHIDFAVVDMLLPGASGFQVVRAAVDGHGARAVMMSEVAADDHQAYAGSLGAEAFLVKPFAVADLVELVGRLRPAGVRPGPADRTPMPELAPRPRCVDTPSDGC